MRQDWFYVTSNRDCDTKILFICFSLLRWKTVRFVAASIGDTDTAIITGNAATATTTTIIIFFVSSPFPFEVKDD